MAIRVWPMKQDTYSLSSGFGPRWGVMHRGLDFAAKDGTPIYAAEAGTVAHIGAADGFGQWIVLRHDSGQSTVYGHMWNAFATGLRQGSRVQPGQLIAYVGSNGQSTGPHLHFEVHPGAWRQGSQIDPLPWLATAGQVGAPPLPPETPVAATAIAAPPKFTELDFYSHKSLGQGFNRRTRDPINFFLHTEEGYGTAESLARYCDGRHGVSYHYTVRDGIVCQVVDTRYYSWSVLSANVFSVNLCFAGSWAGWSREQWLQRERDIEIAAYIAVRDCRKHPSMDSSLILPPYNRQGPGISDHRYVTRRLGIGTHTDVGGPLTPPWTGFPWDVFARYVAKYESSHEDWTPVYNEILGIG